MHELKNAKSASWHIVQTRSANELRAGEELLNLGMTVYVPQYRKEYRHNRSKGWAYRYFPLYPGYLFALESPNWARMLSCDNVLQVLQGADAGSPIKVDNETVAGVRALQDAGEYDKLRVHGNLVTVGDSVKVAEGVLAGLKSAVSKVHGQDVTMLLSIFGREVSARVPIAKLAQA